MFRRRLIYRRRLFRPWFAPRSRWGCGGFGLLLALVCLWLVACSAPIVPVPSASPSREAGTYSPSPAPTVAPAATVAATTTPLAAKRPNIVFILTDDLDNDLINYMPKLRSLVLNQGTLFFNSFVNVSLCCPSRTSTLRGQYSINTKIVGNQLPQGGFQKVYADGLEQSTVAVWLQSAGYKTMLAGKYLNGYPSGASPTYIPPGWSEWYSAAKGNAYSEFDYTLNENGKLVAYGHEPQDYGTDVYAHKVTDFIQRTAKENQAFFVYLAVYAPHSPSTPAPRHTELYTNVPAPRTRNYNETDVSDKPGYIRNRPLLTTKEMATIDADYSKRLQSVQAVDDAIAAIVDTLQSTGQLDNTYIFFTSDNGFHLGNHRLVEGKVAPYEEDIRVPLVVRGPGVPAGQTLHHLVGNIDFAPTWADLAGAKIPEFVDGRSLVPLLRKQPPVASSWRQAYFIQNGMPKQTTLSGQTASLSTYGLDGPAPTAEAEYQSLLEPPDQDELDMATLQRAGGIPPYQGVRTQGYVYIEYNTGERELYNLMNDPSELTNIATTAKADLVKELVARLNQLRKCAGATCRTADGGAP